MGALELHYPVIQFLKKCIIGGQILITVHVIDENLIDFVDDCVFQKIKVSNDFLVGWSSFVRRTKKSSSLFTWKYTRWGMLSIWICRSSEGNSKNYINHCYLCMYCFLDHAVSKSIWLILIPLFSLPENVSKFWLRNI